MSGVYSRKLPEAMSLMDLRQEILDGWKLGSDKYARAVKSLGEGRHRAWTIAQGNNFGVAIPCDFPGKVNEVFSSACFETGSMKVEGESFNVLILVINQKSLSGPFATLCSELLDPGADGSAREAIVSSPVSWWRKWSELLGNSDLVPRAYDVLGELCAMRLLAESGELPSWHGPDCATYDIECGKSFYEIKSTLTRDRREVVIHSGFQLDPPFGELKLAFCQFERANSGLSVDSVLRDLVRLGYDESTLENKLAQLGFPAGRSCRKDNFVLHAVSIYAVDESFPRIVASSFLEGKFPQGVSKISYTVSLDGLFPEKAVTDFSTWKATE